MGFNSGQQGGKKIRHTLAASVSRWKEVAQGARECNPGLAVSADIRRIADPQHHHQMRRGS
jgi:hypothetical protein